MDFTNADHWKIPVTTEQLPVLRYELEQGVEVLQSNLWAVNIVNIFSPWRQDAGKVFL